jgi:hypothetical protein
MSKAILALLLTLSAAGSIADVLLIDGVETDAQSASLRPGRGMSMERVEATFGTPTDKHAAVGEPPITRWDYPGFVVYFEYQLVVHAVARH